MKALLFTSLVLVATGLAIWKLQSPQHQSRGPASIQDENKTLDWRQTYDLSQVEEELQGRALKYRLGSQIKAFTQEHISYLVLNDAEIADKNQRPTPLCQIYNLVELTFAADGVATAGQQPLMIVRGPCQSDEQNRLEPIPIPQSEIIKSSYAQNEFSMRYLKSSQHQAKIYFRFIAGFWPQAWELKSIRLYSDYDQKTFTIDGYELVYLNNGPILINW